jgi:hypothetical protein
MKLNARNKKEKGSSNRPEPKYWLARPGAASLCRPKAAMCVACAPTRRAPHRRRHLRCWHSMGPVEDRHASNGHTRVSETVRRIYFAADVWGRNQSQQNLLTDSIIIIVVVVVAHTRYAAAICSRSRTATLHGRQRLSCRWMNKSLGSSLNCKGRMVFTRERKCKGRRRALAYPFGSNCSTWGCQSLDQCATGTRTLRMQVPLCFCIQCKKLLLELLSRRSGHDERRHPDHTCTLCQ